MNKLVAAACLLILGILFGCGGGTPSVKENQKQVGKGKPKVIDRDDSKEKSVDDPKEEPKKQPPDSSSSAPLLEGKQLVDFVDNTKKYKGKTLTITLEYIAKDSLRDDLPNICPFRIESSTAVRAGLPIVELKIRVAPSNLPGGDKIAEFKTSDELPNATLGTELLVTFLCQDGSLTSGNRAIRITRP